MGRKECRTGSESSGTDGKCSEHRSRGATARHQGPLDGGRVTVVASCENPIGQGDWTAHDKGCGCAGSAAAIEGW